MSTIIKFISDNDVLIMTALLILIILLTIVVLITDYINKKKNTKDAGILFSNDNPNVIDAFKEEMREEIPLEYTTDFSHFQGSLNLPEAEKIKYVEEDEELEKTKAQIELKNLKEELIKSDLERKQREEEETTNKKEEEIKPVELKDYTDVVDKFESDQEQNAIISLDEFSKISDKLFDEIDSYQYEDEGNEPISIKELENLYNTKELKAISSDKEIISEPENSKEVVVETEKYVDKNFKTSPVISPVYGIDDHEKLNKVQLEDTASLDKLSEEIRKTNEFLNTLRELRKNLE